MNFTNKVALVTGAASGMGLMFCEDFIKLGGSAVLVDIDPEAAEKEATRINVDFPGKAASIGCDVRKYDEVCAARDFAVEKFGSIDVLVNFAGGAEMRMCGASGEFPDIPIEVYDWSIDVNLKGQLYFDHAVMKQMRKQNSGVIVNIGSITGEEGCASNIAYSASKSAAMNGLTKSLARYCIGKGIRCVCVSPGPVMTRPGMASMKTAIGRAAETKEMVDLILFVASDKGAILDGVNILADCGRNILFNK